MSKLAYIYTLNDPISGEARYVGKTVQPQVRLQQHINRSREENITHKDRWINSLLLNGLLPKMEIIDEVKQKDWEAYERQYILLFKSMGARLTNLTEGGEGLSGDENPMFGKTHTQESKQKIIDAQNKPVLQYDLDGNFVKAHNSATQAGGELNVSRISISACCRGDMKTAFGFNWKYKDSDKEIKPIQMQAKKVACYNLSGELVDTFNSTGQASRQMNVDRPTITNNCNGKGNRAGQYMFKYFSSAPLNKIEPYVDSRIGQKRSMEARKNMSDGRIRMKFIKEHRANLSKAKKQQLKIT